MSGGQPTLHPIRNFGPLHSLRGVEGTGPKIEMKQKRTAEMRKWLDESVVKFAAGQDPIVKMEQEAREVVLAAVDKGWQGPPFDPIELAKLRGICVRPNSAIADARVFWADEGFEIEYNPHRPRGRVNFSIAHEIAHTFFDDCAEVVRNRSREKLDRHSWQLEVLCNVGAAEMIMPFGFFSSSDMIVSIEEMMRLRKKFQVSAEAILIRLVKLATSRVACFSATRSDSSENKDEFWLHYFINSTLWPELPLGLRKNHRFSSAVLEKCIAIGTTSKGRERWDDNVPELQVEVVGLPPLPGTQHLRFAGFVRPATEVPDVSSIGYRHGDAVEFVEESDAAILHIVNDVAFRWGGKGFARALRQRFPDAYKKFTSWSTGFPEQHKLGAVHAAELENNRYVFSMVAQSGYGRSSMPRIRYRALDSALLEVVELSKKLGVKQLQMPKIGTGQAGGNWAIIEELICERLVAAGLEVRVFELPPR